MATRHDLLVAVDGDRVHARHHRSPSDELAATQGRPCVVMAHGIGATQDSGLDGFVAAMNVAGIAVTTFDYRHFAASSGEPRQLVDPARQIADYHAVIAAARRTDGVDPERIVAWGVSFSGGHVFQVAADDARLAAMVALTPAPDGRAVALDMARSRGLGFLARMGGLALRDAVAARRGRPAVTVPVVGPPGSVAALTSPGAEEGMRRVAGPTWRNEFAARVFLTIASYRPVRAAGEVVCRALVQIADLDGSAPPRPAAIAAERARATVHHYPCDHFDVYTGEPWHEKVCDDQVRFLRRVLRVAPAVEAGPRPKRTRRAAGATR